jgi:hypothetical protein
MRGCPRGQGPRILPKWAPPACFVLLCGAVVHKNHIVSHFPLGIPHSLFFVAERGRHLPLAGPHIPYFLLRGGAAFLRLKM